MKGELMKNLQLLAPIAALICVAVPLVMVVNHEFRKLHICRLLAVSSTQYNDITLFNFGISLWNHGFSVPNQHCKQGIRRKSNAADRLVNPSMIGMNRQLQRLNDFFVRVVSKGFQDVLRIVNHM